MRGTMKGRRAVWLVLLFTAISLMTADGGDYIVQDGHPKAEIVTAENPPSSVRLAAQELQAYIKKITGAELPVRDTAGAPGMPVQIYLGRSADTDRLGVTAQGLEWDAYRVKSGPDWLVLLGDDKVFEPCGIYATSRNDWLNVKKQQWEEAVGLDWGNPVGARLWQKYNKELDLWRFDGKGTLNAVYGFLKGLGVRWYMPGELGEIVPEMKTVMLPEVDKTVEPFCNFRMVAYARYANSQALDEIIWSLRQGVNEPFGYFTHHGIANVSRSEVLKEKHPDYYALYNGVRQTEGRTANVCLSSEGLFQENLRFVRFMFDMYDVPVVDVMPDDGFSSICQCEKCAAQETLDRGRRGIFSDYVWGYVNRMAGEVAKSHPGKFITCGAYSTYWLPPINFDKLSPNLIVYVVNGRRRFPQEELNVEALEEWKRLTGNRIITFMNVGGGANTPRLFAGDMQKIKHVVMGEDMWPPFSKGGLALPGFNHLNYYISALYQWNVDQDIDEVLEEYYRLYYGPAAEEMSKFIDFYEAHQWDFRKIDAAPLLEEMFDLFAAAKNKLDPASVYGQRLALFELGLKRWQNRYELVKEGRTGAPIFPLDRDTASMAEINIDGRLDEAFWQELPGTLQELQTGGDVQYQTRFKIGVSGNNLYVGIKCWDEPGKPFNASALPRNSGALWNGDVVEILLDTPQNSHYQIAVSPMGTVTDLDRGTGSLSSGFNWDAQAEIAVQADEAAGIWTVEARIPFTPSNDDPLHEVIGTPPSAAAPWYFNVCRQRLRDQGRESELSAFSPPGEKGFHNVLKFGRLE